MFARRMLNGAMSKRVQQPFSTMSATASLWAWMEEMVKWLKTGGCAAAHPTHGASLNPWPLNPAATTTPGSRRSMTKSSSLVNVYLANVCEWPL